MGSPPTAYTAKVVIPLPTDDELLPANREKLKLANDLNVARMLAGTDDMFNSTIGIVQAVFQAKDVDVKVRELIILRSAKLLNCPYEWQANIVLARNAGCSQAEIDAMGSDGDVTGIDPIYILVMKATDELTKTGTLTDETLQALIEKYGVVVSRKFVLIIAWFNLLSRFLNGCRVPMETRDKLGNRTSPL
jgi:alkylhydroperoxidase family enzyme